jgi:hypothetical protein
LKIKYIQKLKTDHTKLVEELRQLKSAEFPNTKKLVLAKTKDLKLAEDSFNRQWRRESMLREYSLKNSHRSQIISLCSSVPEVCMVECCRQTKSIKVNVDTERMALDAARRKLSQISYAIIEKELQAAKKIEVCTGVDVAENSLHFFRVKDSMARHRYLLRKDLENLAKEIEAANVEVERLSKISEKCNAGVVALIPGQEESPAQLRAKKARLAVQLARVNPLIADLRVSIVHRTIRLLEDIDSFEKAAKVHTELMVSKSEARVRSKLAIQRKNSLVRAFRKDNLTDLELDSDDSEELGVLRESTKDDLLRLINAAAADPSREDELIRAQNELQALEEKQREEEIAAIDLHADIQIAKARLGAEEAEKNLWADWMHCAMTQETDRPGQGPLSRIGRGQAALDEANTRLRNALREVERGAEQQCRKSTPASEEYPDIERRKVAWVPATAISPANLAKAVGKVDAQAQRAMHRAANCLHGPASTLVSPPPRDWARTCKEISDAERELQLLCSRQRLRSPTPPPFFPRRCQSMATTESSRDNPTPSTSRRGLSLAAVDSPRETPPPSTLGHGQFVRPSLSLSETSRGLSVESQAF